MIRDCCWQMRWMELQQRGLNRVKVRQLLGKQQKKAKAGKTLETSQILMPQLKPCASSATRGSHTSCAMQQCMVSASMLDCYAVCLAE